MKRLEEIFKKIGVEDPQRKLILLEKYMEQVMVKNKTLNLTGIKDKDEFVLKHYIDSFLIVTTEEFKNAKTIVDVGTGGGFPGIPLAIIAPEKEFLLVDSLMKRLDTVAYVAGKYGISNARFLHGRAEEIAKDFRFRENFDLCVSRAVAPMPTLSELCIPFVKIGGSFIAYKTLSASQEIEDAQKAIMMMGGILDRVESDFEFGTELTHSLVVIKKDRKTPIKYPRKPGTPTRKPLLKKDVPRGTLQEQVDKLKNRGGGGSQKSGS